MNISSWINLEILPTWKSVPFRATLAGCIGYVCGLLNQNSPKLWAKSAVISILFTDIFFLALRSDLQTEREKLCVFFLTLNCNVLNELLWLIELNQITKQRAIALVCTNLWASFIALNSQLHIFR